MSIQDAINANVNACVELIKALAPNGSSLLARIEGPHPHYRFWVNDAMPAIIRQQATAAMYMSACLGIPGLMFSESDYSFLYYYKPTYRLVLIENGLPDCWLATATLPVDVPACIELETRRRLAAEHRLSAGQGEFLMLNDDNSIHESRPIPE